MSEAPENEEQEEQQQEQVQLSPAEETARKSGWRPEDEWAKDDAKRPQEFTSPEIFNDRKGWVKKYRDQNKKMAEMEASFNTRLDNSNKLHEANLEMQKKELVAKRDAAIDLADRETANRIQNDIDSINAPAPQQNQQATLDSWNQSNTWIYQNGPKSAYAKAQLNQYIDSGLDVSTALSNMDADIAREFPDVNQARSNQPSVEGGSRPGGKRPSRAITMTDLTNEERAIYKNMPDTWKTEADFLKAVQDSRGS
ncbi:MAG: hypothetical protein JKY86_15360 [Gammaproteobacteria bacterium]|nr:hypothetical protein [Gammaproteobacteria bacterium]